MTLRTKLFSLFLVLALGPLIVIGAIGGSLSERALSEQLEEQTRLHAYRAVDEVERRMRLIESDLRFLGENAESERLLRTRMGAWPAGPEEEAFALTEAETFLEGFWSVLGGSYLSVELRDRNGDVVLRRAGGTSDGSVDGRGFEHVIDIPAGAGPENRQGQVQAVVRLDEVLPTDLLDGRFGRNGVSAVLHRPTERVLYFSDGERSSPSGAADAGLLAAAPGGGGAGPVRVALERGPSVGWLAETPFAPIAVLSLADRAEFSAPFDRQRNVQLLVVLLLAGLVLPAGWFLLRRTTRSLDELTLAADQVASGNFAPNLPRQTDDEVGRLTSAFRAMANEIGRMLDEIERSRQLAAVGAFAAELSHEIRNPLTSIKLNLQRLERILGRAGGSEEVARPLEIALRQVGRLDRVLGGTLRLGRPVTIVDRRPVPIGEIIAGAAEPLEAQLAAERIELTIAAGEEIVDVDGELLTGAILNVMLNAVEAMSGGGRLEVATTLREEERMVEVRIADTGSGIPAAALERLFTPFSSTKRGGTGLGLALAQRVVEAQGGMLSLHRTGPEGTEFRIRLPATNESANL